jgi:hypothetical protein
MEQFFTILAIVIMVALFAMMVAIQSSRTKAMLEQWADTNGYEIISRKYCRMGGPFWWRKSENQVVHYVTIRTPEGHTRRGWVRCGSRLWAGDYADVKWDE